MKAWSAAAFLVLGALLAGLAMLAWQRFGSVPEADSPSVAEAPQTSALTNEGVVLDAPTMARLGIRTAPLTAATAPTEARGFARALDIAPLAAIEGDIAIASAAAAASAAELTRTAGLAAADQSASARAVQQARAAALADQARVDQAVRRVAFEFGPGLARLDDAARARLVADAAAGRAALVRIDLPGTPPPAGATIGVAGAGEAMVIGAAAMADPRFQANGVLAVLRGAVAGTVTAGRLLAATRSTAGTESGVIVPRSAVLRWHGDLWAYQQLAAGHFSRRQLVDARPVESGWFTAAGVRPGDRVAIAGAGALLAAERGADAPAEDG